MMLTLRQVTLRRGHKLLLDKADLNLFEKQKIGFVGHNGCGKSSFFSLLKGELLTDSGEVELNAKLRISHLSQTLPDSNETALDFVLGGDEEYLQLINRLQEAEKSGDDATVIACHTRLDEAGGYSKPAQAASILAGLGFKACEQDTSVSIFSGGWRMRLSLARCLMKPADLLLLDEPTNHLDMEAIFWLENWLKQFSGTIILISHDRAFLDAIASHILHIEQKKITIYTGNYSAFENARAENIALQQAQYAKQQIKIKHMMTFVERFRAKATKAKQAQSRLRAIEKMDVIAKAQADSPFSFSFYTPEKMGKPLIRCDDLALGYEPNHPILRHINFACHPGDKIGLLGPNGQGKSTFIKALSGALAPLSGNLERYKHLHVGYFSQHQLDTLDEQLSPIQTIALLSQDAREQTIRNFLGGFNFRDDMAQAPIKDFSGGEKARLALAKIVWLRPNLLLLDEPTNHLDIHMRSAIELALQTYEGALMVVSHDRHFLQTTVNNFYLIYNQKISSFDGDMEDYQLWLAAQKKSTESSKNKVSSNLHREKRSLQNRVKMLEQTINKHHASLKDIESNLASPGLYEQERQSDLQRLINLQKHYQQLLEGLEEEWLEVTNTLENLGAH